jgi:hypothetical protein
MSNERRNPDLSEQQVNRLLRSYLREEWHEDANRVASSVLDELDTTPQRRSLWAAWRSSVMNNNLVRVGLAAAAVVIIAIVLINLIPGGAQVGGEPSASPSVEPSERAPSAEPSSWTGLPAGPFVVTSTDDAVQVTFDIASPGWSHFGEFDYVGKDDDGLDSPESVGVALLAWSWPAGTVFNVYADPCLWRTTIPTTAATTPDAFAAALAAQAQTDATAPEDVTVGGYAGKAITLHVPMSYHQDPDVGREQEFAECDEGIFGFYAAEVETEPSRNAQGPGQIDELWILDVNGSIVILDGTYGPAAPADLVDEMRAMAESATFEAQ